MELFQRPEGQSGEPKMAYNTFMGLSIALIAFAFMVGPGGLGIALAGGALACHFMANRIAIGQIPASQQTITVKAKEIQ